MMILKYGKTGQEVRHFQTQLVQVGYSLGTNGIDGIYGKITENQVKNFQEENKLTVDGIAGSKTQTKINNILSTKIPALSWIEEAKANLGIKEVKGKEHNPDVVQYWKDIKRGGIKDDETPWCAAFVGAMLERVGIRSTRFEGALSYETWGNGLSHPVYGCVVVFTRNGGGHVGFVVGQDNKGNLLVLGGNQGDQVNIKAFGRDRVKAYRYPPNYSMVDALPVSKSVEFSDKED